MSVSCGCSVLSFRGLCGRPITRPEESYGLWCVVVCDIENFMNEEDLAHWGLLRQKQSNKQNNKISAFMTAVTFRVG